MIRGWIDLLSSFDGEDGFRFGESDGDALPVPDLGQRGHAGRLLLLEMLLLEMLRPGCRGPWAVPYAESDACL
jgi:hypothetical protein